MLIVGQLVSFTFTHNSALLLMLYYYGLASIYAYNDKCLYKVKVKDKILIFCLEGFQ